MPHTSLVVEDDKDLRRNMGLLLESEGYLVKLAEHGQAALDVLGISPELPSVIILDLAMPVMDGFQFQEERKKVARYADIPLIVMTADGRTQEKGARIGASLVLRKPSDVDVILDAVAAHVPKRA